MKPSRWDAGIYSQRNHNCRMKLLKASCDNLYTLSIKGTRIKIKITATADEAAAEIEVPHDSKRIDYVPE